MKGGRKLSQWNIFVKKVYQEGKAKDSNYDFKQALTDASKRKGEMGSQGAMGVKSKKNGKKSIKKNMKGGKTRKHRRNR